MTHLTERMEAINITDPIAALDAVDEYEIPGIESGDSSWESDGHIPVGWEWLDAVPESSLVNVSMDDNGVAGLQFLVEGEVDDDEEIEAFYFSGVLVCIDSDYAEDFYQKFAAGGEAHFIVEVPGTDKHIVGWGYTS